MLIRELENIAFSIMLDSTFSFAISSADEFLPLFLPEILPDIICD